MNKLKVVLCSVFAVLAMTVFVAVSSDTVQATELASSHAYYDQLDADEKIVYTQLLDEMKAVNRESITLEKSLKEVHGDDDQQGIMDVFDAIYHDHPEIYWFGSINTGGGVGYTMSSAALYYNEQGERLPFEYTDPETQEVHRIYDDTDRYSYTIVTAVTICYNEYADAIETCDAKLETLYKKAIEGVSTTISTSETVNAKKVMTVHNNLCKMIKYDYEGRDYIDPTTGGNTPKVDNTVYGTLKNGKAVCAGYARTFQYILQRLGIECYCVVGDAMYYNSKTGQMEFQESHEWNVIKLGSDYLNVDVTWGDRYREDSRDTDVEQASYISFSYFAVADADEDYVAKHRNSNGTKTIYNETFSDSHVRSNASEKAVPHAETKLSSFKDLFGIERTEAFIENFDEQYVAVVTSVEEYFEQLAIAYRNGSLYNTSEYKILEDRTRSLSEKVDTKTLVSETRYILIIGEGSTGEGLDLDVASALQSSQLNTFNKSIKEELKITGTVYKVKDSVEYNTTTLNQINEGLLWTDIDCAYWTISQCIGYISKDCTPTGLTAYARGDINGDKIVDSKDAIALLMSICFPSSYEVTQSEDTTAKDMNGDGKVTVDDALYLLMNVMNPTDENYSLNSKITIKTE